MAWQFIFGVAYCFLSLVLVYLLKGNKRRMSRNIAETEALKTVPNLGIIPLVKLPLNRLLTTFRITYGNILKIKLGLREILVINDFLLIEKIINNNEKFFQSSWRSELLDRFSNHKIMSTNLEKRLAQKTIAGKILKRLFADKSMVNEIVQSECEIFLSNLNDISGNQTKLVKEISANFLNIITKVLINKRFSVNDSEFRVVDRALTIDNKLKNFVDFCYLMFPRLENSTALSKCIFLFFPKIRIYRDLEALFDAEIKEHGKLIDCNKSRVNFIDQFFQEQTVFAKDSVMDVQVMSYVFKSISAEYEVTLAILEWSLVFMSKYPDIQKKVHNEIVEIIGTERPPTVDDKEKLNFTLAVMDEILRIGSPIPSSKFYRPFKDTTIDDISISAKSLIFLNLYASNVNPKIWEKPLEFYPHHFLVRSKENSSFKYLPRNELLIFGLDKKKSFGESLAQKEYFIFFTSIMQRFQVNFSDKITAKQYNECIFGSSGPLRSPNIKDFVFEKHNF